MQSKKDMPKVDDFTCPQIYQRLVIGADGLCMMCANDEEGRIITGDANKQTIHEIWHSLEMTRVREIHSRCAGADELSPCGDCYLPLETFNDEVSVGNRTVIAEKYNSGIQKVSSLKTPEKFKRPDIKV